MVEPNPSTHLHVFPFPSSFWSKWQNYPCSCCSPAVRVPSAFLSLWPSQALGSCSSSSSPLHHLVIPLNVIILINMVSSIFLTPCYVMNCVPPECDLFGNRVLTEGIKVKWSQASWWAWIQYDCVLTNKGSMDAESPKESSMWRRWQKAGWCICSLSHLNFLTGPSFCSCLIQPNS